MFGNSWVIGCFINFTSNGSLTMMRLASQTKIANAQMGLQTGLISKNQLAMEKYAAKMEALRGAATRVGIAISGALAVAGVAGMTNAIEDASKLQQILLSIKNETNASKSQTEGFYNTIFKVANQNGMTPVQAGEIMRSISRLTAGQFTIPMMQTAASTVGEFASMVHFNRPDVSVHDAAETGIQTSHLFRAYQPAALTKLLDTNYRLSGLMAESLGAALKQMTYYVPLFKSIGVPDQTSVALMAVLDRAGFKNKVGTNVRAEVLEALGPMQLTKHAQDGKLGMLKQMGLFDSHGKFAWNTKSGGLDFFGEIGQIAKWATDERKKGLTATKIAQIVYGTFGKQGGTIAALFADPQMTGILAGIQKYLSDPNVGLKAGVKNRDAGLGFQFTRAMSNFTAVMTELGYPWLENLSGFFKGLADNLHGFQIWLHTHRNAEKVIGAAVAGLTTIFAGLALVGTGALAMGGAGFVVTAVRNLGLVTAAVNTFSGILGGAAIGGIPGIMLGLRMAIMSFATTVGGAAVVGIPSLLGRLAVGLIGLVGPIGIVMGAIAGLMLLTTKSTSKEEGTVRAGRGYGSQSFWEQYAKVHGWKAVPSDVTERMRAIHAADAAKRASDLKPQTVSLNITVNGGSDPQKHGQIVGARVVHELAKHGLIRNAPLGAGFGGSAVPSAA